MAEESKKLPVSQLLVGVAWKGLLREISGGLLVLDLLLREEPGKGNDVSVNLLHLPLASRVLCELGHHFRRCKLRTDI